MIVDIEELYTTIKKYKQYQKKMKKETDFNKKLELAQKVIDTKREMDGFIKRNFVFKSNLGRWMSSLDFVLSNCLIEGPINDVDLIDEKLSKIYDEMSDLYYGDEE